MVDTLLLRPSLHFTTLHSISLYLSTFHFLLFKLDPSTLHYPHIWLNPIQIPYRSISSHITKLHLTSLHCTFRRFSPHFYSFHFTPFLIAFLNLFLKILGLPHQRLHRTWQNWDSKQRHKLVYRLQSRDHLDLLYPTNSRNACSLTRPN